MQRYPLISIFSVRIPSLPYGAVGRLTLHDQTQNTLGHSISVGKYIYLGTGSLIQSVGVPILDEALSLTIVSILFTIFCLVALTNALNCIDGINGLASGKTMIVAGAILDVFDVL